MPRTDRSQRTKAPRASGAASASYALRPARKETGAAPAARRALKRFEKTCSFVGLSPAEAEGILLCRDATAWHLAFAASPFGGEATAHQLALGLSALRYARGDFAVAEKVAAAGAQSIPLRGRGCRENRWVLWGLVLESKMRQLLEGPAEEREARAREIFDLAVELFENQRPFVHSAALYAHVYDPLRAVAEMLDQPVPVPIRDRERRGRAADVRVAAGPRQSTFAVMRDGLIAIWRRDGPGWWRRRYKEKFGEPAPADLIWYREGPAAGFQTNPDMWRLFDKADDRAYLRAMESTYRAEAGLPQRGEGWVTQVFLEKIVVALFPGLEVRREARLPWLEGQRLDIFVPALALAIEYNGMQHYFPVDLFGGEQGLADRQEMDQRKREKCAANGVRLIEWRYSDPVTHETVRARLVAEGLLPGQEGDAQGDV